MSKTAKHSFKDSKGKLYVDCSECTRGGNGDDQDKCAAGWRIKRGRKGGCYMGTLLPEMNVKCER